MEQRTYKLELTLDEIMQAGNALGELPFKNVAALLQKFAMQVEEQDKQREEAIDAERSRNR